MGTATSPPTTTTARCVHRHLLLLLLQLALFFFSASANELGQGQIGVVYPIGIPNVPEPAKVVPAIRRQGIPRVRLLDPDAAALAAFVGSGIDVMVAIQDLTLFESLGKNSSFAQWWVTTTVVPSHPESGVTSITVGYGILTLHSNLSHLLLPALANVYNACRNISKLADVVVGTAHSYSILVDPFPPSSALFNQSILPYLHPVLEFTAKAHGPFYVDCYPYDLYRSNTVAQIKRSFVVFEADKDDYITDPFTRGQYTNLFSLMVDSVILALYKLQFNGMPVVIVGTGWPSGGDPVTYPEAGRLTAAEYNDRLALLIRSGVGTPLRPNPGPVTYIYSLFDEPRVKGDPESLMNYWGMWFQDLTKKYPVAFTDKSGNEDQEEDEDDDPAASGSSLAGLSTWLIISVVSVTICNLIGVFYN